MIRFDCDGAVYDDKGEPSNLEAAALDAIEWLALFERQGTLLRLPYDLKPEDNQRRLQSCIGRLAEYLHAKPCSFQVSVPPLAQSPKTP